VHQLVQEELHRKKTVMHPNIEMGDVRAALAVSGVGLDHFSGEQAMVFGLGGGERRFDTFGLVTDRRICGACHTERFDVRFSEIAQLTYKDSLLDRSILLSTPSEQVRVIVGDFHQPLGAFLRRLTTVPADQREPRTRPLSAPSESDPTGAASANAALGVPDERTTHLLMAIEGGHARGEIPLEIARDFVTRIALLHRSIHFGRGMAEGRWLSPLGADDLSNAMVQLYGSPLSHQEQPVRTLEFPSNLKSGMGKAAVSSAIGLASAAVLGVGWVSTAKRRIARFRFMVADTGSFGSFRLQDPRGRGLHLEEPSLLMEVDGKLLGLEDDILARRVAFGWNAKTPELLLHDPTSVAARLAALAAEADRGLFVTALERDHVSVERDDHRANVHGMINSEALSHEEALAIHETAVAAMNTSDPISQKLNAASKLMLTGDYEAAANAFREIAEAHPEVRGDCFGNIGAAHYFVGRYQEAIQWYQAAIQNGADLAMMQDNIVEAEQALS
jgi:hypothetical protein